METKPFINLFKEEELLEARRRPVHLVKSFQRNWDLLLLYLPISLEEELEPAQSLLSREVWVGGEGVPSYVQPTGEPEKTYSRD